MNNYQRDYVSILSKDDKEFYLDIKVAKLSSYFANHFYDKTIKSLKLDNIDSHTMEIIL